ncbi:MAG TPA: ATP-binding protein [Spirochaetia bacterium]
MSRASGIPILKQQELTAALSSALRETAFENRYVLHPRRLGEMAGEICAAYVRFLETDDGKAIVDLGARCAREGLGERTVPPILGCLRRFTMELYGLDMGSIAVVDMFAGYLLEGYMTAREDQILRDQEQLRQALSSALESKSRELLVKNHAINTAMDGIMLTDLEGKATWVNASFLALWGYRSPAEVNGRLIAEFLTGEDKTEIHASIRTTEGWRGELEGRRKDGTTFSIEVAASLIRNETGTAIGYMASFLDITEKKRLLAQVIQAQKMEALGQLAGGITHDFNNLLTAISGYLQLLILDAPPGSRTHQDLMQIRAAVERGTGLTQQLRLFTRQTKGNRQVMSLNDVVKETWEILKRTFPPMITIELELASPLWPIEADPNQMSQVLVNLCVNARDAMINPNDLHIGGTLVLTTSNTELAETRTGRYMTAPPGRYISVRVKDTGAGIPPEIMERLFVPFVTTKSARSGTGLGLAVVYGIVASHHGFIDVQSTVGRGTVFEVLFPMTHAAPGPAAVETPATALAQGHGAVLVVEDDPQIREIMARVLVSCGYTVTVSASGEEALARFGDGAGIDLVVLDNMMPGMSGRECLEALRAVDPRVRVLFTTGDESGGSARELPVDGIVGIVEKPLDMKVFTEMVKRGVSSSLGDG